MHELADADSDLMLPASNQRMGLSGSGRHLAVGSQSGALYIYDIESGKLEEVLGGEHNSPILSTDWD